MEGDREKLFLAGILLLMLAVFSLAAYWQLRPIWLTQMHGAELQNAVKRYIEVTDTLEGNQDPKVMEQVATGPHLELLIQYRCQLCDRIQVATRVEVPRLQVLDYSETASTVRARVEWGWQWVDKKTRIAEKECFAQGYTIILMLTKKDGVWKVSDGGDISPTARAPEDDTPELRAKYCPSK